MFYNLLPTTIQYLLASYLWGAESPRTTGSMKFELRHTHGLVPNTTRVVFSDVSLSSLAPTIYDVRTKPTKVSKPKSQADFFSARSQRIGLEGLWDETEVVGPNVHDRETLLLLAKMANNAYEEPGSKGWYDLPQEWNTVRYLTGSAADCGITESHNHRVTHLDGSQMRMASEDTSSLTKIILLL